MAVLDTDLIIAYLRRKDYGDLVIHHLKEQNLELKITAFTMAELYKGCYAMANVAKGLMKIQKLLEIFNDILPFDDFAIQEYAKIAADLKKRGESIGAFDELIASVCIANNETLYTRNVRHFQKITGMNVVNWFELGQSLADQSTDKEAN
jgi:tRNA(fMet)-specific endonuclease VapC